MILIYVSGYWSVCLHISHLYFDLGVKILVSVKILIHENLGFSMSGKLLESSSIGSDVKVWQQSEYWLHVWEEYFTV